MGQGANIHADHSQVATAARGRARGCRNRVDVPPGVKSAWMALSYNAPCPRVVPAWAGASRCSGPPGTGSAIPCHRRSRSFAAHSSRSGGRRAPRTCPPDRSPTDCSRGTPSPGHSAPSPASAAGPRRPRPPLRRADGSEDQSERECSLGTPVGTKGIRRLNSVRVPNQIQSERKCLLDTGGGGGGGGNALGTLSLRCAVWVIIPEDRRNSAAYIHTFVTHRPPPPTTTFFCSLIVHSPFWASIFHKWCI